MNYLKECQSNHKFWNAFREYGGALSYDSIDSKSLPYYEMPLITVQSFLDSLKQNKEYQKIDGKISIGYLCQSSNNALVKKIDGHYYLGVNCGLVDSIIFIANTIFSSPDTFLSYGDFFEEINRKGYYEGPTIKEHNVHEILSNGMTLSKNRLNKNFYNYKFSTWPQPINWNRKAIAKLIVNFAVEFVILHELSHIFCGHIDYLIDNKFNSSFLTNSPKKELGYIGNVSHWMETDADILAFQMMHNSGFVWPKDKVLQLSYFDPIRKSLDTKGEYSYSNVEVVDFDLIDSPFEMHSNRKYSLKKIAHQDMLYFWHLSIQILQYLFIQDQEYLVNWESGSHPHPMIRIMSLSPQFYIDHRNAESLKYHFTPWARALTSLSELWSKFSIPGIHSVISINNYEDVMKQNMAYRENVLSNDELIYTDLKEGGYRIIEETMIEFLLNKN